MSGYIFSVVLCLILVAFLVQLLRKRRIKEKYAGLWIVVAVCVVILGAFPGLAESAARLVGITLPVNLVFSVAILILLIVCIQLSVGVSNLDERVRTLTEEIAMLRLQAETGGKGGAGTGGKADAGGGARAEGQDVAADPLPTTDTGTDGT